MAKKLLMIDDHADLTGIVGLIASQIGMEFKAVSNPLAATETFIDYRPDVVMLDIVMPEKDGIDILNELLVTGIPTQIVLTSSYGEIYLRIAAGVAKFHNVKHTTTLKKPFRPEELVELLKGLTLARW